MSIVFGKCKDKCKDNIFQATIFLSKDDQILLWLKIVLCYMKSGIKYRFYKLLLNYD